MDGASRHSCQGGGTSRPYRTATLAARELRDLAPGVETELAELTSRSGTLEAAASGLLREEWEALEEHVVKGEGLTQLTRDATPAEALGRGLARAVAIPIGPDFAISEDQIALVGNELLEGPTRSWEEAFQARLNEDAHHLTRVAVDQVDADDRERLEQLRADRLAAAWGTRGQARRHTPPTRFG